MGTFLHFYCPGAGRSGTTWLYRALSAHAEIDLPRDKYSNYFRLAHGRGEDWYRKQFVNAESSFKVRGDFGVSDLADQQALDNLASDYPGVKIIVCVRNPIERDLSAYNFLVRNGDIQPRPILEIIDSAPPFLSEMSFYGRNLQRLLQRFCRSKIFILHYEELQASPQAVFDDLCEFLEIKKMTLTEQDQQPVYQSSAARIQVLATAAKVFARWARALGKPHWVGTVKHRLPLLMKFLFTTDSQSLHQFSDAEKRQLWSRYTADVATLEALLDKNFSSWQP